MERSFDFEQAMKPVWDDGGTAYCESAAPVEDAAGEVWIPLYYEAGEILELRSADLQTLYVEGRDYRLEGGGVRVLRGGAIPTISRAEQYPAEKSEHTFDGRNGIAYLLFGEGTYFHERQLAVTYRHGGAWRGVFPQRGTGNLPVLAKNLTEKNKFRLLIYGDSIAAGGNASGFTGAPPYLPRFGELFAEHLSRRCGAEIETVNTAVGGMTAKWGFENAEERAAAYSPDLALIAFGMNDGSGHRPAAEFAGLTKGIIEAVRVFARLVDLREPGSVSVRKSGGIPRRPGAALRRGRRAGKRHGDSQRAADPQTLHGYDRQQRQPPQRLSPPRLRAGADGAGGADGTRAV